MLINQQNSTLINTQAVSLDLLKANGAPTLYTDSNGNHYLISLASNTADGQNRAPSLAKTNGRVTLQVEPTGILGGAGAYVSPSSGFVVYKRLSSIAETAVDPE